MKKFILTLFICVLTMSGFSQSNSFYTNGDITISLSPTVFLPISAASTTKVQYGYSYETLYWANLHAGAGLEFGTRDFNNVGGGYVDHFTALVAYRIIPFPTEPLLGRWSLMIRSGAQTWTTTGAKGTLLGFESDYALTHSVFVFVDVEENFETTADASGLSAKAGFKLRF